MDQLHASFDVSKPIFLGGPKQSFRTENALHAFPGQCHTGMVQSGLELLQVRKLEGAAHPESTIRRLFASPCHTHLDRNASVSFPNSMSS